uniref:Uncharacterized protein n=1 Tax=Arundo donax TaxID=35708 RepID=A0A0A9BXJ6_ARUDO
MCCPVMQCKATRLQANNKKS